jgi:uncharacterized RDD family membrane protein YckC
MSEPHPEPGWYRADGDPSGSHRYWDGTAWVGEPQPLPDSAAGELPLPLGSPWQRIIARLIDVCVIVVAFVLIRALVDDDLTDAPSRLAALATLLVGVAYEAGMIATIGATGGKLVMGLRVISRQGVTPPSARAAVLRWLPNLLSLVPFLGPAFAVAVLLASMLWLFTDRRRRTIFDRMAKTLVITLR